MHAKPTRILIVDDAVVTRRLLSRLIEEEDGLAVAGTAPNGRVALGMLERTPVDAVVLDLQMPVMDGISLLREMRRREMETPVIVFSILTARDADLALLAMTCGAHACLTKPPGTDSAPDALNAVREELIPQLRALTAPAPPPQQVPEAIPPERIPLRLSIDAVGIGVSTGGPEALTRLLPALPADFPVPLLVVQHMPAIFTRRLAERLAQRSLLAVSEAQDGEALQPAHIYFAPGDYHMRVVRDNVQVRIALSQDPPVHSCRPAADCLLQSLASVYGGHALGLIMTGMGQDGTEGCRAIRQAGGLVLAQDAESSVVWGMPGAVAQAGLADAVLPLANLPEALIGAAEHQRDWRNHL